MAIAKKKGESSYSFIADGAVNAALSNPANVYVQGNTLRVSGAEYQLNTLQMGINSYNYGAALGLGLVQP